MKDLTNEVLIFKCGLFDSFESGNGIKIEENGYQKDGSTEKIQVIQGSVSYTDNEGNVIHLK